MVEEWLKLALVILLLMLILGFLISFTYYYWYWGKSVSPFQRVFIGEPGSPTTIALKHSLHWPGHLYGLVHTYLRKKQVSK